MCAVARKLRVYNWKENELLVAKWTPNTNEVVYLSEISETADYQDIADTAVGHLPMTAMKIPIKDMNSLVTHNTAILGILGVGKSCLKGLFPYIDAGQIQDDLTEEALQNLENSSLIKGTTDSPESWGNLKKYVEKMEKMFPHF